jgi:hypothetical protein
LNARWLAQAELKVEFPKSCLTADYADKELGDLYFARFPSFHRCHLRHLSRRGIDGGGSAVRISSGQTSIRDSLITIH